MYIKQMIIQGFKSYKTQTIVEPFSPGINIVVGRNGAGKSNFFAAIRFVLSDAYAQLSREERQGLLHEGSGTAVTSAYVDIIFDNSDERFSASGAEVSIRRTIGVQKDEYTIDRKVVTKGEVVSFLASAGFSLSNPYYIVPQGRITALTNMKESERLSLLKEVAGTKVYESRRAESLALMEGTDKSQAQIDELLEEVGARLRELHEEREELKEYQLKERERRCLEYAFFFRRQARVQESLDEIEGHRQDGLGFTDSNVTALTEAEEALKDVDGQISKLTREADLLEITRRQLEEDRREKARALGGAELKLKTLSEGLAAEEETGAQRVTELDTLGKEMKAKNAELAEIVPDYDGKKLEEDEIRKELDGVEAGRGRLFDKQSHGSRFKNKKERDAWLREQNNEVAANLAAQNANRTGAEEEIQGLKRDIRETEDEAARLRGRFANWSEDRDRQTTEATDANARYDKLLEERKRLRREEERLDSIVGAALDDRNRAEKELSRMMDVATARGLDYVRRLKKEKNISGAYGTMAELLETTDVYRLAVEQTAGASLFHYVVDNADTATALVKELQRKKAGRVTFVPLAEVRPNHSVFPRSKDAVPLIGRVRYDPMYEKAFLQVFGKTVVCPNLAVADQYARSHGLDAITLEGDNATKRGAISGGYIDRQKSRLLAVRKVAQHRDEYEKLVAELTEVRRAIEEKDQEVTRALGETRKLEQRLDDAARSFGPLQNELRTKTAVLDRLDRQLEVAVQRRDDIEKNMHDLEGVVAANEAELATDFKKSLSADEERQMEELGARVQQLKRQWNEVSNARRELGRRRQALEFDMSHNLQLKIDQLTRLAIEESTSSGSAGGIAEARDELRRAQMVAADVDAHYQEAVTGLEKMQQRIARLRAERAAKEAEQLDIATRIDRQHKKLEKSVQLKGSLQAEMASLGKSISDLGVLPEEAFDKKYENMEQKTIEKRLKKVIDALGQYKHVNKKAFEQYAGFLSQQEQLLTRRKELDDSRESIETLIAALDQRKDEALERTFKQVSREFARTFEKLVPAGHGRLVIQRRADRNNRQESDDEAQFNVDSYTGVGISVSFNSKTMDEQQKIQQLSGGQKSLCALCLIFALQLVESSPMVIFDEVDANLDAQYRTAVAQLIQATAEGESGTQFICTTFRPEIVQVADKCYGVTFHNKTSSIDCYSIRDALEFVSDQQAQR